jgi:site-specific DNA recombinase
MRVAVYVRVSTQRQVQSQTIEQQLERLQAHIQAQGWQLRAEDIFRDDGYSGAYLVRPGLDRLRDRVAQGDVDRVLITTPDRLARNYVHQVLLLEELERTGCQVEFLDRPMSHDPHDQLLLQIRGAVAEYERALIAERMRRGRLMKLRAGLLLPWTRAPYGYRLDPDRPRDPAGVRVELTEAAIVAEIFAAYLVEGQSLYGVAKHLMDLQAQTPTGHWRWSQATIRQILRNPVYMGHVYAGRTRVRPSRQRRSALSRIGRRVGQRKTPPEEWVWVAQIPAIVTQEQFEMVQAKLSHNHQFATRNNTAHLYLLRGLVSCGRCRTACRGRTNPPTYGYYTCRAKAHPIQSCRDEKCLTRYIPAQQLDELVWRDLCDLLTHPAAIAQALHRAHGGHWLPQALQAQREQLGKARLSLDHQLDRLTEAYLEGVIPLAEYERRRQDLEQRRQALDTKAQQLEASVNRQAELATSIASIDDFCQRVRQGLTRATFAQKRHLVELLIDRVVVTNEEVEIRYVIPTSPRSEHVRFCHLRKDYFTSVPRPEDRFESNTGCDWPQGDISAGEGGDRTQGPRALRWPGARGAQNPQTMMDVQE